MGWGALLVFENNHSINPGSLKAFTQLLCRTPGYSLYFTSALTRFRERKYCLAYRTLTSGSEAP